MTPDNTPASVAVVQKIAEYSLSIERDVFDEQSDYDRGMEFDDCIRAARECLAFQQPGGEVCKCLSQLEDDAYEPGGPMSGRTRPRCPLHSKGSSAPAPDAALRSALEVATDEWHRQFYPKPDDFTECGCLSPVRALALADRLRELANAIQGNAPTDDPRPHVGATTPSQKQGEGL